MFAEFTSPTTKMISVMGMKIIRNSLLDFKLRVVIFEGRHISLRSTRCLQTVGNGG